MSRYNVDFVKLVAEYLPPKKRKPVRIKFLFRLCAWLRKVHAEFLELQQRLSELSRVTGQVIIIENYLNEVFGQGISIVVHEIALNSFSVPGGVITANGQENFGSVVYHNNENITEYNFTVNVPLQLNVDRDQLKAIIEKYKTPGSKYQIIEL